MIHIAHDKFYSLNVSGGRTSAYMLRLFLDHWGGVIPPNVVPVFTNTGKERAATLDFVHLLSERWDVEIVWLEYTFNSDAKGGRADPKNTFREVDYRSASRDGRPFSELIDSRQFLPNVVQRICTQELKVKTIARYMRKRFRTQTKHITNILGIRKDEKNRVLRLFETGCNVICPLYDLGVTVRDVNEYWKDSSFDLSIPTHKRFSNCDMCFLKGKNNLVQIAREEPNRLNWWKAQEAKRDWRFIKGLTYSRIEALSKEPTLFDDDANYGYSCFCGD